MASRWTTPDDIRVKVRARWDDGTLLRALAAGDPFPFMDLPVSGPKPSEIGEDLTAVRRWASALEAGATQRGRTRYLVIPKAIGGRHVGRNQMPGRVHVTDYDQAWELLGVGDQVAKFRAVLELSTAEPAVHAWVTAHPLLAMPIHAEWWVVLAAYRWLLDSRESGRYLRQVDVPGIDTKFIERHRALLARLLDVPSTRSGFVKALGLSAKPETLRLRFNAGAVAGLPALTEATLRVDELVASDITVRTAIIVENEITFLSLPVPADGLVLWGKGFEVDRAGSMPWLRDAEVLYWGDLDTHGFAILHQLRAWLPQTHSFLMDRDTLLAHRDRWGSEDSPTSGRLDRLTDEESALYAELVSDRYGDSVRLEQERVDWSWVQQRLSH